LVAGERISEFLAGVSAASGIALVTSIRSLGGFVGPFVIGAVAKGAGGIYRGFAVAGISLFVSATLVMFLPKKEHQSQALLGKALESP
jgi:ACS family tartrate transporter-like MFS transporter